MSPRPLSRAQFDLACYLYFDTGVTVPEVAKRLGIDVERLARQDALRGEMTLRLTRRMDERLTKPLSLRAFNVGLNAGHAGRERNTNPYRRSNELFWHWDDGWLSGRVTCSAKGPSA